jgi:TPR repeat protein
MSGLKIFAAVATVVAVAILVTVTMLVPGVPARSNDAADCGNAGALINADPARAVAACRRQADQGDAVAQTSLGKMYADGRGVSQDYAEAQRRFRLAANQGNPTAQYNLGLMYAAGQGMAQDYAEATRWYRLAADQGQSDAQNNVGIRYKRGQGVAQDYVQAYKWFRLSAANATRMADRARVELNRDKVAALMTAAQVAEAEKLAAGWTPTKP